MLRCEISPSKEYGVRDIYLILVTLRDAQIPTAIAVHLDNQQEGRRWQMLLGLNTSWSGADEKVLQMERGSKD